MPNRYATHLIADRPVATVRETGLVKARAVPPGCGIVDERWAYPGSTTSVDNSSREASTTSAVAIVSSSGG